MTALLLNVRALGHCIRVDPRLSFRAFVVNQFWRLTVCLVSGHKRGDRFYRLLGLCERCMEPIPA